MDDATEAVPDPAAQAHSGTAKTLIPRVWLASTHRLRSIRVTVEPPSHIMTAPWALRSMRIALAAAADPGARTLTGHAKRLRTAEWPLTMENISILYSSQTERLTSRIRMRAGLRMSHSTTPLGMGAPDPVIVSPTGTAS